MNKNNKWLNKKDADLKDNQKKYGIDLLEYI